MFIGITNNLIFQAKIFFNFFENLIKMEKIERYNFYINIVLFVSWVNYLFKVMFQKSNVLTNIFHFLLSFQKIEKYFCLVN